MMKKGTRRRSGTGKRKREEGQAASVVPGKEAAAEGSQTSTTTSTSSRGGGGRGTGRGRGGGGGGGGGAGGGGRRGYEAGAGWPHLGRGGGGGRAGDANRGAVPRARGGHLGTRHAGGGWHGAYQAEPAAFQAAAHRGGHAGAARRPAPAGRPPGPRGGPPLPRPRRGRSPARPRLRPRPRPAPPRPPRQTPNAAVFRHHDFVAPQAGARHRTERLPLRSHRQIPASRHPQPAVHVHASAHQGLLSGLPPAHVPRRAGPRAAGVARADHRVRLHVQCGAAARRDVAAARRPLCASPFAHRAEPTQPIPAAVQEPDRACARRHRRRVARLGHPHRGSGHQLRRARRSQGLHPPKRRGEAAYD
ncbi:uncharacterized protein ACA1_237810 [Acanthamoeba castellanii str. Neff]|uniref:Uncharacterized protein n=1 Tax=Acanthamoeba castellanii (strain ATCC 30010 / Neff) TaxID=1257118 RepID=L8GKM7_ACACF|nr:uncharacterized protein ACA1_237810 [Acanthamoeba castellanii str. Neff]ELR13288.1 hypothetical protein ACA1_237810 [Acanthamoeba castellanii str. Neff]